MALPPPFNLSHWIDEHRSELRPPVGNRQVYPAGDFIVMVVGGPNARTDYHVDPGAEFFHQIEGAMTLRTIQDGRRIDYTIGAGDVFLLPPNVPHSPQRSAGGIGLVIERRRQAGEEDGIEWYCERCDRLLYAERFHLTNIETDLPPVFNRFNESLVHRTCRGCGHVAERPEPAR